MWVWRNYHPGKEIERFTNCNVNSGQRVKAVPRRRKVQCALRDREGQPSVRSVLGPPEMGLPRWKLDPVLSKLATGKLQLEVKEPEKVPQKQEKEKEAFTAWGKRSVTCKQAWASAPVSSGPTTGRDSQTGPPGSERQQENTEVLLHSPLRGTLAHRDRQRW